MQRRFDPLPAVNVVMLGQASRDRVRTVLRGARAFLFAAEEDFGIAPVEAQACGTPVVALGRGGALETVFGSGDAARTGVFFPDQTPELLVAAIREFERLPISRDACRANAERFSEPRFRQEFGSLVEREWDRFRAEGSSARS